MSKEKCCGNCKHFKYEDVLGNGYCRQLGIIVSTNTYCEQHEGASNGWTEITPDNVEKLYEKPVVVAWQYEGKSHYRLIGDCMRSPSAMAMKGGYYYYVLPELKLEESK